MKTSLTALATIALSAALWLGGPAQADTAAPLAKGQLPAAAAPAPVAAPAVAPEQSVEAIFDERMTSGPMAGVFAAVARHFPDEMRAYRARLIASINAALATGAPLPDGVEHGRALLRGLAPLLAGAADADLIAILDDQIALYAALRGSPRDCARVFMDGMVLEDFGDPRLAGHDFAARTDRLYGAMAAARGRPARAAAEIAHYGALGAMLLADPAGVAALESVERADPADPLLCDGAIRFLEALRDARFAGADRLRAEMLVDMMAG